MRHTAPKMLVFLLVLAIAWFPLAGFSAGCSGTSPAAGSRHAASGKHQLQQLSHVHADSSHFQDTSPACPDCDTHQHDCNGNHTQCSSGISLILQSQVYPPEYNPSSWLSSQNTSLPGTHPAPAIRPPISI